MKRSLNVVAALLAVGAWCFTLHAQQPEVTDRLAARGVSVEFAEQVLAIATAAAARDLPTEPIVSKALEGWAKRGQVPLDRVLAALGALPDRLAAGQAAVVAAGLEPAPGALVAAAAEGLGRGMTPAQVGAIVTAAPTPEAAATAVTVAASLAAQGLEAEAASQVVRDALAQGQAPDAVLEFPSVIADLLARGVPMSDVARQILEGRGLPVPFAQGIGQQGGPPHLIPPSRGPPSDPPGKSRSQKP